MNADLLPDFLGIGAVKAGTTWLYRNLYQHPALYLPVTKPVRYFDLHADRPLATYQAIFRPGAGRLCGEFSASYSVLPPATIASIRRLMPDLKLILLLREPKSRAWSEAKMEFSVVRGLGDQPISDEQYCTFIASQQCMCRGDYRAIVAAWAAEFPREQIFIGLYDDVRDQPRALFDQVLGFLGVSSDIDETSFPLTKRIFEGRSIAMPARCRSLLDAMYQPDEIRALEDLVGMDLTRRWGYR